MNAIKNITALDELRQMDLDERRRIYPTVPQHAMTARKFSDKTANGLTACIIRYLQLRRHKCWRQSSEGRYRQGHQFTDCIGRVHITKGKYIPGTNRGHADCFAVIAGLFCCWEIKMNDRQNEVQKQFQRDVEDSAGKYFIARSFEQFLEQYKQLTQNDKTI